MNTLYLSNSLPFDTTFPFGASEALRLTKLVVEGITHVKDLVVTGRANGVARVMELEEAVDATPGQLGSCGYVSGVRYEVSSLDERNNPVWQKVSLSNL